MRFHVIGFAHIPTQRLYNAEPFIQKIYNFCKMMTARGHTVYHYGIERSDPPCTERIEVVSHNSWYVHYGQRNWKKEYFSVVRGDSVHQMFLNNTLMQLRKRVEPGDFIISFGSYLDAALSPHFPQAIAIEAGIGYSATGWARFKIYESYSILHAHYAINGVKSIAGSHECTVIPNYFDLDLVSPVQLDPQDYFVFLGRLIPVKGLDIAIELTRRKNKRLIIAGVYDLEAQGYKTLPSHVEFIGHVDELQKDELLKKATALLAPTLYHEPFGNVTIEAMLRGVPVITTDRGAFTETVRNGFNGYRCTWASEFEDAAEQVTRLDRSAIAAAARNTYSFEAIAPRYEAYCQHISQAHLRPHNPKQKLPVGFF